MTAFVLLPAALPIVAITVLLVKFTSPGPALYTQWRLGRGGQRFRIYKLRTMTHQCEVETGPVWSLAHDPRVTRVGRWLRDTHLDELPQLWNVLRGEMALVGPRPERPELAEKIERSLPQFNARLAVRPGITGLAQVRLPPDVDIHTVQRKLVCDLHYIRHVDLFLDLRILIATGLQLMSAATSAASRQLVKFPAPVEAVTASFDEAVHDNPRAFRGQGIVAIADVAEEPEGLLIAA